MRHPAEGRVRIKTAEYGRGDGWGHGEEPLRTIFQGADFAGWVHRGTQAKSIGGMSNRMRKGTNSEKYLTFPGRGKVPVEYS